MKERIIRGVAGSMILISVILTLLVSTYWLILAALVGLNLLQSSFTRFCPLECALDKQEAKKKENKLYRTMD